jgi:hypothetical protein
MQLTRIFHGNSSRGDADGRGWEGARSEGDAGILNNMSRRPNKRNVIVGAVREPPQQIASPQ